MEINDFGNSKKKKVSHPYRINDPTIEEADCYGASFKNSQWAFLGNGAFLGTPKTIKTLLAGLYYVSNLNNKGEPIIKKIPINVDDMISFENSIPDKTFKEIEIFWSKKDRFDEFGFLHRRGYLFYGPQGSGKTIIVQQIIKNIIEQNNIVFFCKSPSYLCLGLKTFRDIEPMRPIVCVFEDIDAIIKEYGDEDILSLLDGEQQINQVLNIATTNYPECLDKRLVSRPRRFDRIIKINNPTEETRRLYFIEKLKCKKEEADVLVKKTKGLSFAALSEIIISTKCLGNSLEDTLQILKEMSTGKTSSEEFSKSSLGFGAKEDE